MKENILPAIKLTLLCIVFFSGIYAGLIWGIAQFSPNQGKGFIIKNKDRVYYENIGQAFHSDRYFWSRPSANAYDASASCGSNKGPSDANYLKQIQVRIDTFLVHHPGIKKSEIPVDLITSSGSGLDPHISPKAARIQVKRIALKRHLSEEKINDLVNESIRKPFLGLFGPETVHVLQLNLKLDKL